jgi:hypothetical protein
MGAAWARHAMCELALTVCRNGDVLWGVMLCRSVSGTGRFGRWRYLYLELQQSETIWTALAQNEGHTSGRKVGNDSPNDTGSQAGRVESFNNTSKKTPNPARISFSLIIQYSFNAIETYLLSPWNRVLLDKLTCLQLVKKFPAFYGTPKVLYHIHKCPVPVPILNQLDSVHTPTSHLLKIHLNIILPPTPGSPEWSLTLRFPHQTLPLKLQRIFVKN